MTKGNGVVFLVVVFGILGWTGCDEVSKSDFHARKGQKFFEKGKYQEAEAELRKAIEIRRESGQAHYYLALVYLKTNRYGKAVSLMRFYIEYIERTRAWVGPRDDEYTAKMKVLYTQQTGEVPVRRVLS